MNKQAFYNSIRASLFNGRLTSKQIEGINFKLDAFDRAGITDDRWRAYMLATAYHETGKTMQPVEEYGKGRGRPYGRRWG